MSGFGEQVESSSTTSPESNEQPAVAPFSRFSPAPPRKDNPTRTAPAQAARHPRLNPSIRVGGRRKFAVEGIELEALPCYPSSTGRPIAGHDHEFGRACVDRDARACTAGCGQLASPLVRCDPGPPKAAKVSRISYMPFTSCRRHGEPIGQGDFPNPLRFAVNALSTFEHI
jgi:hypothetical protein